MSEGQRKRRNRQRQPAPVGSVFGHWTVIDDAPPLIRGDRNLTQWLCRCVCDTVQPVQRRLLVRKNSTNCGCQKHRCSPLVSNAIVPGDQVGWWSVVGDHEPVDGTSRWRCRCVCGVEVVHSEPRLIGTRKVGCGCRTVDIRVAYRAGTIWNGIVLRCTSSNRQQAAYYVGRGITICPRWRRSQDAFLIDVGPRPGPKYEIDRIDNDGGYTCGNCTTCQDNGVTMNCRWTTHQQQALNRRSNRLLTWNGETMTVAEWAVKLNVDVNRLYVRLHNGWSVEEAFSIPQHGRRATHRRNNSD